MPSLAEVSKAPFWTTLLSGFCSGPLKSQLPIVRIRPPLEMLLRSGSIMNASVPPSEVGPLYVAPACGLYAVADIGVAANATSRRGVHPPPAAGSTLTLPVALPSGANKAVSATICPEFAATPVTETLWAAEIATLLSAAFVGQPALTEAAG